MHQCLNQNEKVVEIVETVLNDFYNTDRCIAVLFIRLLKFHNEFSWIILFIYITTIMARRISKSSIDWAKFASVVPKSEMKNFSAFKARSDAYLTR